MKSNIIENLIKLSNYFKECARENILFEPERIASAKIASIIQGERLDRNDLKHILEAFNEVTDQLHYNGSGWHDFKLWIMALIREHKFGVLYKAGKLILT